MIHQKPGKILPDPFVIGIRQYLACKIILEITVDKVMAGGIDHGAPLEKR